MILAPTTNYQRVEIDVNDAVDGVVPADIIDADGVPLTLGGTVIAVDLNDDQEFVARVQAIDLEDQVAYLELSHRPQAVTFQGVSGTAFRETGIRSLSTAMPLRSDAAVTVRG